MQQANIDFMTQACIVSISNNLMTYVSLLAHKGHIKAANVNFCFKGKLHNKSFIK